jgi:hypothetical protein
MCYAQISSPLPMNRRCKRIYDRDPDISQIDDPQ